VLGRCGSVGGGMGMWREDICGAMARHEPATMDGYRAGAQAPAPLDTLKKDTAQTIRSS
jgi:hypothetical protein